MDEVERTALARSLFRQGVELSDRGEWADAADRFRRSLRLRHSPIVEFNLGTALTHTGRLVEAAELFRRAVRDGEAPARLREAAQRELDAVQPRLGQLTLSVTGPIESVTLELDGDAVPPEQIGVPVPADPGHHVLAAMRNGRVVARAEADVPEQGEARIDLEVPPAPLHEEVGPLERDTDVSPHPERPAGGGGDDVGLILGVVGGIVLVAGAAVLTTVLVLEAQGPAAPIEGNLGPPVIEFD